MSEQRNATDNRRAYPRLKANFTVRFGICGEHGQEVPGFTNDLSLSGFSFTAQNSSASAGDHIAVEISVPGYGDPLYFLGQVIRTRLLGGHTEIACQFDWLGKADLYREKLEALLKAHGG
ncbi:MAG: PilZ domain-containing protein [Planctomycetota bacterium]